MTNYRRQNACAIIARQKHFVHRSGEARYITIIRPRFRDTGYSEHSLRGEEWRNHRQSRSTSSYKDRYTSSTCRRSCCTRFSSERSLSGRQSHHRHKVHHLARPARMEQTAMKMDQKAPRHVPFAASRSPHCRTREVMYGQTYMATISSRRCVGRRPLVKWNSSAW